MNKTYRSIFISDVHLGTRDCKAEQLNNFLKNNTCETLVKRAVDFIFKFEENLANYCKKKGYDGVICGHIHHAEIKEINGVMYMNDGDWVESCTALVEHHDGRWQIITWTQENDNVAG
jgi:UDP-2,3-diacylglucosamine pyrophosphatase LpxH